jgi:uncharacterized protein (TIGR03067 family)
MITALLAAGGSAADRGPSGDLAKLQGRWTTRAGPGRDIPVVLEIDGRRALVKIAMPNGPEYRARGELRINENAAPRTLDWVHFSGQDGQELPDIPAIYELNGHTFTVCNGGPNNQRPTEFKPGKGALADLLTFTRPE